MLVDDLTEMLHTTLAMGNQTSTPQPSQPPKPARILTVYTGKEVLCHVDSQAGFWELTDRTQGTVVGARDARIIAVALHRRLRDVDDVRLKCRFDMFPVPMTPETLDKDLLSWMLGSRDVIYNKDLQPS